MIHPASTQASYAKRWHGVQAPNRTVSGPNGAAVPEKMLTYQGAGNPLGSTCSQFLSFLANGNPFAGVFKSACLPSSRDSVPVELTGYGVTISVGPSEPVRSGASEDER